MSQIQKNIDFFSLPARNGGLNIDLPENRDLEYARSFVISSCLSTSDPIQAEHQQQIKRKSRGRSWLKWKTSRERFKCAPPMRLNIVRGGLDVLICIVIINENQYTEGKKSVYRHSIFCRKFAKVADSIEVDNWGINRGKSRKFLCVRTTNH